MLYSWHTLFDTALEYRAVDYFTRKNSVASVLVGKDIERIRKEYYHTLSLNRKPSRPELWDGKTANPIVKLISNIGYEPDFSILKAFSYENLD